jgi:CysZ protein
MTGAGYFWRGLVLLRQPGIRLFVIVPLLVNLVLFVLLTTLLVNRLDALHIWLAASLADWLQWLLWLLWPLVIVIWLVIYGYSFALVSHVIAAPFYGLLAERVEGHLRGQTSSRSMTARQLAALVLRSLGRELQKLLYFLPRLAGVLVLALVLWFIPGFGLLVPVVLGLWGAWALSLETLDCAADNGGASFATLRRRCARRRGLTLSFGAVALVGVSVPLFNLVALPAAVAGGTALWVECLSETEGLSGSDIRRG